MDQHIVATIAHVGEFAAARATKSPLQYKDQQRSIIRSEYSIEETKLRKSASMTRGEKSVLGSSGCPIPGCMMLTIE